MWNVNGENVLDTGRTRAQDYDSIRKLNSLIDIVRNEDDRSAFTLPDAQ
jgi:hypothetical protein